MRSKIVVIGGLAAAALLATACGAGTPYASSPSTSPSPSQSVAPVAASPTANASAQPTGTTIAVANTRLGRILVDSNGRTVYLFLADSGSTRTATAPPASRRGRRFSPRAPLKQGQARTLR